MIDQYSDHGLDIKTNHINYEHKACNHPQSWIYTDKYWLVLVLVVDKQNMSTGCIPIGGNLKKNIRLAQKGYSIINKKKVNDW